jgi:hypothetical protein
MQCCIAPLKSKRFKINKMEFPVYGFHGEVHECFPAIRRALYCINTSLSKAECSREVDEYLECWNKEKRVG